MPDETLITIREAHHCSSYLRLWSTPKCPSRCCGDHGLAQQLGSMELHIDQPSGGQRQPGGRSIHWLWLPGGPLPRLNCAGHLLLTSILSTEFPSSGSLKRGRRRPCQPSGFRAGTRAAATPGDHRDRRAGGGTAGAACGQGDPGATNLDRAAGLAGSARHAGDCGATAALHGAGDEALGGHPGIRAALGAGRTRELSNAR